MNPKYQISQLIHDLSLKISELVGQFAVLNEPIPRPKLRKLNRLKTIHSSCAIEGNALTFEQATAVIDNKRVLGDRRDILEIKNAFAAYEKLPTFDPTSEKSLLVAHRILMKDLIEAAGVWREKPVAVMKGSEVVHLAPPATQVAKLMRELLTWLRINKQLNPLISSAIFHYEFEFIHPFIDGNGRLGRLWHHLILSKYRPLFEYVPMETAIRQKQQQYYQAIRKSTAQADVTPFIEYCLKCLHTATLEFIEQMKSKRQTNADRINLFKKTIKTNWFSKKDYMLVHHGLGSATASRDLLNGVELGLLEKQGLQATTRYRFKS